MGKFYDMNLINFIEQFPDEESCKLKFKEFRNKEGVVCRKCGNTDQYWLSTIWQYQCKKCKTRTTLRSGTVMQASNLPYRCWFIVFHLLTSTKRTLSALELQKQIGHKFYEPIWYMLQKLRKTMGVRDSLYKMDRIVELDEGFFESVDTEKKEEDKGKKYKRGRGSERQSKVIVMTSTINPLKETGKHKKPTKFRFVKMKVVDDLKSKTIEKIVDDKIVSDFLVRTDAYRSYNKLHKQVWVHQASVVEPSMVGKVLPWVHTMISNSKRNLLGIHHMISKKYFQDYIDEFCYKVNRRYFGEKLFDRLMIACVSCDCKNFVNDY